VQKHSMQILYIFTYINIVIVSTCNVHFVLLLGLNKSLVSHVVQQCAR